MENWVEATIALRAQISTAPTVLVLWIIVAVAYQVQMKVSPLKSFGLVVLPIFSTGQFSCGHKTHFRLKDYLFNSEFQLNCSQIKA